MGGENRNTGHGPPLGARPLMAAIKEMAEAKELVAARVDYKENAKGEHVIALIFRGFAPPQ